MATKTRLKQLQVDLRGGVYDKVHSGSSCSERCLHMLPPPRAAEPQPSCRVQTHPIKQTNATFRTSLAHTLGNNAGGFKRSFHFSVGETTNIGQMRPVDGACV